MAVPMPSKRRSLVVQSSMDAYTPPGEEHIGLQGNVIAAWDYLTVCVCVRLNMGVGLIGGIPVSGIYRQKPLPFSVRNL